MSFYAGNNFPEFSEFQKSLKNLQRALEPKFQELSKNLGQSVQPTLKKIGQQLEAAVQEQLKPLQEAFQKWIEIHLELSENIEVLASYGWYLSSELIDELHPSVLLDDIQSNEFEKIENKILVLFKKKKKSIQERLLKKYPKRSQIIDLIFQLHEEKKYLASIPLCYAQADGICNDRWEINFFKADDGTLNIYRETKGDANTILDILINQLKKRNEQNQYDQLIKDLENSPNRHGVMHGRSLNYGTKKNSVQAILLLDFLRDLENFIDIRDD